MVSMDKLKFGALFISVFFVVSIIASGFLYTPPPIDKEPTDQLPDINPTQISMQAENVEARVVLLLPKLRVGAAAKETNDISSIDSSIYAIQGVKRVVSRYSMSDETEFGTGLIYIADVQLSGDADAEQVFSQVQQIESLEAVDGFASALVSIPEEIEFTNPDLNVSKFQSLKRNETEALVSFETIREDQILVSISATFIGLDAIDVVAFEVENLAAAPSFGESTLEAEVASLDTIMLVDIKTDYSGLAGLEAVEQGIASLAQVSDLNLTEPFLDAKLSLSADGNISEETASDLNAFLHSLSDDVIFYNLSNFNASLFFEQGTGLQPVRDSLEAKLEELGLGEITLRESIGHAYLELELVSGESAPLAEIEELLAANGFDEFSSVQPGKISLAEVETEFGSFEIDSGLVDSGFVKSHSVGDKAQVSVTYSIVRGQLSEIGAVEVS